MYCPTCSTQAIEGAKFCKTCGLNLSAIAQALNGGVVVSDPVREREFKRSRKQISDGIHGSAIGAALIIAAALPYFLIKPMTSWAVALTLMLALGGIVKLFLSIGKIVDAKIGPKLLDPALQPRATGGLSPSIASAAMNATVRPSQRLDAQRLAPQPSSTRPVSLDNLSNVPSSTPNPPVEAPPRIGTGRINREHSTPLRRLDGDDLMSKLRN
ncbi:MAG TPA: zinc ribbon domain-containing protein [Blastocatellia bacterium]|nr:zinc ribbon domain-containing protein [Blastocatellia bacterium]